MAISPVLPISIAALFVEAGTILLRPAALRGRVWLDGFLRWQDRQRQRAALRALDARLLRDVGLSRAQAEREARRHD